MSINVEYNMFTNVVVLCKFSVTNVVYDLQLFFVLSIISTLNQKFSCKM